MKLIIQIKFRYKTKTKKDHLTQNFSNYKNKIPISLLNFTKIEKKIFFNIHKYFFIIINYIFIFFRYV
jgi:hypothetical protein